LDPWNKKIATTTSYKRKENLAAVKVSAPIISWCGLLVMANMLVALFLLFVLSYYYRRSPTHPIPKAQLLHPSQNSRRLRGTLQSYC
jgi:hypothetical protein